MNKLRRRCDLIEYFRNTGKPAAVADISQPTRNKKLIFTAWSQNKLSQGFEYGKLTAKINPIPSIFS